MFVEDLSPLFADFGVPAIFGAESATVLLDMPQEEIFDGLQQSTEFAMTYRNGDLPSIKGGSSGTVNGVAYIVRQTAMLDDGKLIKAMLRR
jgi:hypothetical protein